MKRSFLLCLFLAISVFSEARLPDQIPYRKGNKWGYADSTRKIIIPCLYDSAPFFANAQYVETTLNGQKGKLWQNGRFDPDTINYQAIKLTTDMIYPGLYIGDWVGPVIWNSSVILWAALPDHKLHPAYGPNEKLGYARDGKMEIPYQFAEAQEFSEGRAAVKLENGKMGYIDTTGKILFTLDGADELNAYLNGTAVYHAPSGYGIVDRNGNILQPPLLDYLEPHWNVFVTGNNNSMMLLTRWGNMANRKIFQSIEACDDYFLVDYQEKYGTLDKKGKQVIPCKYDVMYKFQFGFAAADLDGQWGFVDKKGRTKIPFKYSAPQNGGFLENGLCTFLNGDHIDVHGTEYWEE